MADEETFVKKLGCGPVDKVKVVSIFGNTGDGKSYTLNHTFFNGSEVNTGDYSCVCIYVYIWV